MKNIGIFLYIILPINISIAQSTFDQGLIEISKEVSSSLEKNGLVRIAVWRFVNLDRNETRLGNYVSEDFSINLTNAGNRLQVMERYQLDQILNEHQLSSEGYIDAKSAKKLGRMLAVDYIVTGNVEVIGDKIKLRLKVLDTETAMQVFGTHKLLSIDETIASFLNLNPKLYGNSNGTLKPSTKNTIPNQGDVDNRSSNKRKLPMSFAERQALNNRKYVNKAYRSPTSNSSTLISEGSALVKLLFPKEDYSNGKPVIRKYKVDRKYTQNRIKINVAYYSKESNSVFAYIKANENIVEFPFRVVIVNKKGIEIANSLGKITLEKNQANYYEFKFDYVFEYPKRSYIIFE